MIKSVFDFVLSYIRFYLGDFRRFSSGLGVDFGPEWNLDRAHLSYIGDSQQEGQQDKKDSMDDTAGECILEVPGQIEVEGTCTEYGACRYHGHDYMYQVGIWQQHSKQ